MRIARNKRLAATTASNNAVRSCGGGGCGGSDIAYCIMFQAVCGLIAAPIAAASAEKASKAARTSEAAVAPMLGATTMQDALRDAIIASAQSVGVKLTTAPPVGYQAVEYEPDYLPLAAKGLDTVLEVALTQVFSEPAYEQGKQDLDPLLPLDMRVHVRLIKTSDNSVVFSDDYSYHGKRYQYTEWAANNGERLMSALKSGYESLGRDISDRIFLLYPFAERMGKGESGNCGLGALGPKDNMAEDLSPLLSWQSFPRESDLGAAPEDMKLVKNVRYDLIVGIGGNHETPEVIYRVEGLADPSHKIPMTLNPNTRYFWSVRARFDLKGRLRVTDWATDCPFEQQLIVGARLYRFYTPKSRSTFMEKLVKGPIGM